jgi:hypothetical protein
MMIYGNKGAVWENKCHLSGPVGLLCGGSTIATNWARIEGIKVVGCPKCLEIMKIKGIEQPK